jgi:hypothetical protein
MRRNPLIVTNRSDVDQAVRSFAPALATSKELQERLPYARAWYAKRNDKGGWLFAPSKWAGYLGMSADTYLAEATTAMDGRKTELRLSKWFTPLRPDSKQHAELHLALKEFLAEYGKQPSAICRISIIEGRTHDASDDDDLVELIVRVAHKLNGAQQAKIRAALGG